MKILHLADLHFGKLLYGVSMVENGDQKYWVDQMLASVREEKPDVVVIAGDVYDRGIPPKEAVELLDFCLTELVKETKVLVVSGNHDSGERLSFAGGMLRKQGLFIAGKVNAKMECVTLEDEFGPVHFWLMPYVFPAAIKVAMEADGKDAEQMQEADEEVSDEAEGNEDAEGSDGVEGHTDEGAGSKLFASYDSAVRAYLAAQDINNKERNVLVAHQLVVHNGNEPEKGGSESMVGGVGQIEADAFDGFDYVALGHIHGAQSVGKKNIRYAGAPLCYHFDEIKQKKGLLYISLMGKEDELRMETKEIPVLHPMRQIEGCVDDIIMTELVNDKKQEYIRVVLQDEQLHVDARAKLKSLFEGKGSILMDLSKENQLRQNKVETEQISEHREKTLEEHFLDFYAVRTAGEEPDEKEMELIRFVTENTLRFINSGEDKNANMDKDVQSLVEFCLKQEEV